MSINIPTINKMIFIKRRSMYLFSVMDIKPLLIAAGIPEYAMTHDIAEEAEIRNRMIPLVCVLYCLILSIIYKSIDMKLFMKILLNSAATSGIILFLISASSAMSWVMAYSGIPAAISSGLMSITTINTYFISLLL